MAIDRQQIRYITLRKQIGTQTQVAVLLAVTARTVNANHKRSLAGYRDALSVASLCANPPSG